MYIFFVSFRYLPKEKLSRLMGWHSGRDTLYPANAVT